MDVNSLNPTRTVEATIVITASHDTNLAQNRRALAHCLARSYDASPSTTHRFVRGLARRGRQSHHRVRRGMCYRPHPGPSTIQPLQPSTQTPGNRGVRSSTLVFAKSPWPSRRGQTYLDLPRCAPSSGKVLAQSNTHLLEPPRVVLLCPYSSDDQTQRRSPS